MKIEKCFPQKIQTLTDSVEKEFGNHNSDQLNWKCSAEQWSIGQCLDHLIVSNGKYLPVLNEIVNGKHIMTFWEKYNPMGSYTGRQMLKTLGTNVLKKYKTPKLFTPTNSFITQNIIVEFKNQQDEIFKLFQELEKEKYSSISITSPVATLITLKLHDLIKLIISHEHRHINQAIHIKYIDLFPKD